MRGSDNDGPQVRYIYQREGEARAPPPRRNAAEIFQINHKDVHSTRDNRRYRSSVRELHVRCPQLDALQKRRSAAETRVITMGKFHMHSKVSQSSLCPDCVESLIAMRKKRRRRSRTRGLKLTLNDVIDVNEDSNTDISECNWSEENYEPSHDSYRSAPSVSGDAMMMMRSGLGGRRRSRKEASQGFLCPDCIKSLKNLSAALKRQHQEKVASTRHRSRYKYGSGIRRRPKNAVLNLGSPSKCIILENVENHVLKEPIENITKMATLFVNKMALPPRDRGQSVRDTNAKSADRNVNFDNSNVNLDDSNANLDDWNRSDDSQEPSLSTHRSFPSLSDEPMVREASANDVLKDRSRKRLCEVGDAGAGPAPDGGGCKRCKRNPSKKEEPEELNQN